jgi:hypothetical protein
MDDSQFEDLRRDSTSNTRHGSQRLLHATGQPKIALNKPLPFVERYYVAVQPALSKRIPFVVSPSIPFVVSLSNHERNPARFHALFERKRAIPIPDDRPVPRPALRANASRMFATASCLRSALRCILATLLKPVRGEPTNSVRGEPFNSVRGEPFNSVRGESFNSVRGESFNSVRGELVEP